MLNKKTFALGVEGVEYMIADGRKVNFKFNFGAPSCVPATSFETAGATVSSDDIERLLKKPDVKYLAEMMNWPGVLAREEEVMKKIVVAQRLGKPVDGHAPGLIDRQAEEYISAGISTDHECFTYEEGLGKLKKGMKILIREGSAAKNFEALVDLFRVDPKKLMFCSDDKHPDDLIVGHIDQLVRRTLAKGFDVYDVLLAACVSPVEHYGLDVGLLKVGDPSDFILIDELSPQFKVTETWINGQQVASEGISKLSISDKKIVNRFNTDLKSPKDFSLKVGRGRAHVIDVEDGQLVTEKSIHNFPKESEQFESDTDADVLKLTVVNRYENASPSLALVRNFGLTRGALASSVAHDSHNIVAVGTNDKDLANAVNLVIRSKGGISYSVQEESRVLPLEVAGLMTTQDGYQVAHQYTQMTSFVQNELGAKLAAPYMTLSFLALLVIPKLKLSDKGLFDAEKFQFLPLIAD